MQRSDPILPTMSLLTLGNLEIDPEGYEARIDGRRVHLTFTEFELLSYLARERSNVVPPGRLIEAVWSEPAAGDLQKLRIQISRLRKKIEASRPWRILTVKKRGYVLAVLDERMRGGASGAPSLSSA